MCAKKYDNESIRALKGAARVRKRPAVIFGSDGIDGCEHSMFEILSNSIDEAREGFGDTIIITQLKLRISAAESRSTTMNMRKNITGNLFSVNFMPAENTKTIPAATMSIVWVLTGWAPVLPNTAPNIWMWRFSETDINMSFILKPEKISTE